MSDFYTNIKENTVNPLMLQFGKNIDLQKKDSSTYDPTTGSYSSNTYSSFATGYAVQTEYKQKDIDGKLIKKGDKKLLITQTTNENLLLVSGDRVVMNSETWNVIHVGEVKPGNIRVIYKDVQVRKG
jgi:hypothetical protein